MVAHGKKITIFDGNEKPKKSFGIVGWSDSFDSVLDAHSISEIVIPAVDGDKADMEKAPPKTPREMYTRSSSSIESTSPQQQRYQQDHGSQKSSRPANYYVDENKADGGKMVMVFEDCFTSNRTNLGGGGGDSSQCCSIVENARALADSITDLEMGSSAPPPLNRNAARKGEKNSALAMPVFVADRQQKRTTRKPGDSTTAADETILEIETILESDSDEDPLARNKGAKNNKKGNRNDDRGEPYGGKKPRLWIRRQNRHRHRFRQRRNFASTIESLDLYFVVCVGIIVLSTVFIVQLSIALYQRNHPPNHIAIATKSMEDQFQTIPENDDSVIYLV